MNTLKDLTYLSWTKTRHSSGTAGSFLKAFEIKRGKKYYYKLSNYDPVRGIVGHECVNEIVVDRLLTKLGIPHLSYELIHAKILLKGREVETWVCSSVDYKTKYDRKIALDAFYDVEALPNETPMDFCIRMGFEDYIYDMLLVDFLILNRDRHGANTEILKDRKTKMIKPAPLFDHGLSLCFSCYRDEQLMEVDPLQDKPVQCFVGSHSSYENLTIIPEKKRRILPVFDEELRKEIFRDLDGAVSDTWKDTVWNFIITRARIYEDFCNK